MKTTDPRELLDDMFSDREARERLHRFDSGRRL
jgi:hypothetical protein